jgi:hypothetical protein
MKIKHILAPLIILGVLMIGLIVYVYFIQKQQNLKSQATFSDFKLEIRKGKLVNVSTDSQFIIRSNQYVTYSSDHKNLITFAPEYYSKENVQTAFSKMSDLGYNSVRLVFNNELDGKAYKQRCDVNTTIPLDQCVDIKAYLNLVETILIAKQNNLKVILSFVGTPHSYITYTSSTKNYTGQNIHFLNEQSIRDIGRYYNNVFVFLKEKNSLDAILAVEPFAEPEIDTSQYPFTSEGLVLTEDNFYVPSGKEYVVDTSLTTKVNGQSSIKMKEIITYSFINAYNYWYQSIKAVDPSLLVLYDQFATILVSDSNTRHNDDLTLVNPTLQADIIGMQIYPELLKPNQNFSSFFSFTPTFSSALLSLNKPFIIVEFGIEKTNSTDINTAKNLLLFWQNESCQYKVAGWSFFNWSATNFSYLTAIEDNYAIANALSPRSRPVICTAATSQVFRETQRNTRESTGVIYASPNPCTLQEGQALCTSTISWSTSNPIDPVQIKIRETNVCNE